MKVTYRRSGRRTRRNPSLLTLVNPGKGAPAKSRSKKKTKSTTAKAGGKKTAAVSKAAIKKAVKTEVKAAVKAAVKQQKIPKSTERLIGARNYRVFGAPMKSPPKPHWAPVPSYYRPGIREPGESGEIKYKYTHPSTGKQIKVQYPKKPAGWYAWGGYEFTPKRGRNKGKTIKVGPSWRYVKNEEKSMARRKRSTKSKAKSRRTRKAPVRKSPRKRPMRKNARRRSPQRRRVLVLNARKPRRRARRNPARKVIRRSRARRNPARRIRRRRGYRRNPETKATWLKFGLAGFGSYLVGRIVANVIQQNAASLPAGFGQFGALLGTSAGAVLSYYASKKIKALQKYQTPIVIGAVIAVADVLLDSIASQLPAGAYLARPTSAPLALPATGVAGWAGTGSYWGDSGGKPVALTARALSEYVREPAGMGEYIASGMGATSDPHGLDDGVVRGGLFGEPGDDGDFDIILDD